MTDPAAMTPEQLATEIAALQQRCEDQSRHWLRYGYVSIALGFAVFGAIGLKMFMTGADRAPPMILIQVMFVLIGAAFLEAGRKRQNRLPGRGTTGRAP